jgi:hypothetical protein
VATTGAAAAIDFEQHIGEASFSDGITATSRGARIAAMSERGR